MAKRSKGIPVKFELDGAKELERFCRELPKRVLKKALRQAVNAGATPILKAARKNVPRLTGTLKKALKKKVKAYPNGNAIALIGADRNVTAPSFGRTKTGRIVPANYIHLVERGTSPHAQPNNKFNSGQHPGAKASNFLASAVNAQKANASRIMEEKLKEVALKEAAKLASK